MIYFYDSNAQLICLAPDFFQQVCSAFDPTMVSAAPAFFVPELVSCMLSTLLALGRPNRCILRVLPWSVRSSMHVFALL
jgi:hypothetical protein